MSELCSHSYGFPGAVGYGQQSRNLWWTSELLSVVLWYPHMGYFIVQISDQESLSDIWQSFPFVPAGWIGCLRLLSLSFHVVQVLYRNTHKEYHGLQKWFTWVISTLSCLWGFLVTREERHWARENLQVGIELTSILSKLYLALFFECVLRVHLHFRFHIVVIFRSYF